MLGPQEQFTKLSLSGDRPKRENCIQTLCMMLGPDFMTDVIVVETSDHARLSLQVAYNWYESVVDNLHTTLLVFACRKMHVGPGGCDVVWCCFRQVL